VTQGLCFKNLLDEQGLFIDGLDLHADFSNTIHIGNVQVRFTSTHSQDNHGLLRDIHENVVKRPKGMCRPLYLRPLLLHGYFLENRATIPGAPQVKPKLDTILVPKTIKPNNSEQLIKPESLTSSVQLENVQSQPAKPATSIAKEKLRGLFANV
jgi:hypothetical protein